MKKLGNSANVSSMFGRRFMLWHELVWKRRITSDCEGVIYSNHKFNIHEMQQDTANVNTDDSQTLRRFDGNKQFHI